MIKKIIDFLKNKLKTFKDFAIVPYNPNEGIVGFTLRQILLPDSTGNPSWTITITFYVLALIAMVSKYEFDMCKSLVEKFDPNTGMIISRTVKGFSTEYWALLGTLTVSITYLFRQRNKDINASNENASSENTSIVETVINKATEVIK